MPGRLARPWDYMMGMEHHIMEILKNVAYGTGIVIAVSLFTLFLVSFVPHLGNEWDRGNLDRQEALDLFQSQPAYMAMYERFPEAVERFSHSERNGGEMEVGVRNSDTAMSLVLRMYAYGDGISHMTVTCENRTTDHEEFADGLFAVEFINTTDCLDRIN